MAYVVTEPCIGCKVTACVSVCATDAFREDKNMLVINPGFCTDCGKCVMECPALAIYDEDDVPEKWKHYIQLNAERSLVLPKITAKKKPLSLGREGLDN